MLSKSTAEWIKELADGICYEEVKDRMMPTSANAVKTFKTIYTFKEV